MMARIARIVGVFALGGVLGIVFGWRTAPALESWSEEHRVARIAREAGMDRTIRATNWQELEVEMRRIESELSKEGNELFSNAFGALAGRWLAANRSNGATDHDALAKTLNGLTVRQVIEEYTAQQNNP